MRLFMEKAQVKNQEYNDDERKYAKKDRLLLALVPEYGK
jgi:hypothetical protein